MPIFEITCPRPPSVPVYGVSQRPQASSHSLACQCHWPYAIAGGKASAKMAAAAPASTKPPCLLKPSFALPPFHAICKSPKSCYRGFFKVCKALFGKESIFSGGQQLRGRACKTRRDSSRRLIRLAPAGNLFLPKDCCNKRLRAAPLYFDWPARSSLFHAAE